MIRSLIVVLALVTLVQALHPMCSMENVTYPELPAGSKLVKVVIVARHGDRVRCHNDMCWDNDEAVWECPITSVSTFASTTASHYQYPYLFRMQRYPDPHSLLKGNCIIGALTSRGYQQWQEIGAKYRHVYVDKYQFLTPAYREDNVYLRAHNMRRCVESTEAMFTGLYPAIAMNSQPRYIDLHTTDDDYDTTDFGGGIMCPMFNVYRGQSHTAHAWTEHMNLVAYQLATDLMWLRNGRFDMAVDYLRDCITTHVCHDQPMPANLTTSLIDRIHEEINWRVIFELSYPNVTAAVRVGSGFLFRDIRDAIMNDTHKFHYYGSHDTTLIQMMLGLEIWAGEWTPYASHITFEVFEKDNTHYMRILYNWVMQKLPWCDNRYYCPLETAMSYISTFIITDMSECAVPQNY